MFFESFKTPAYTDAIDNPAHCNSEERPEGIPDPQREDYLISEAPCRDCRQRTWAAQYPWGGWYSSPFCHACLNKSMTERSNTHRHEQDESAARQAFLNAGLTKADVSVEFELDPRLKRLTRDPSPQCFAYLVGSTGTGKTSQAVTAVKHYVERGWRCRYLTETDLIRLLQAKHLDVQALRDLDLLVLDEFGSSNPATWQSDWIREVIDGRYRQRKPTVLSSNHSLRTLSSKEGLGRLIIERIFECSRDEAGSLKSEDALYVECDWSYRIGANAKLPEGCINSPFTLGKVSA